MRALAWRACGAVTLCVVAFASTADAAVVTLKNAWMRPAAAGSASAEAYVDIVSDTALELHAASTPVARDVEIVLVSNKAGAPVERVVARFPVAAGGTTRLAYLGNHLRLKDVQRDVGNGDPVPLTLTFTDAAGNILLASTDIVVRGLLRPQQMGSAAQPPPALPEVPAPATSNPALKM